MSRTLQENIVVVESPAKAKTINKYLGSTFKVLASYGHVRDLIPKNNAVDPEHDFEMHYIPIDKNKKSVNEIATALKSAKTLYLAPDPDREGEAIAWHLLELLKNKKLLKNKTVYRISFNQITKAAIENAIDNPRDISKDLVDAQQARRALDFLVGFNLSPLLWRKIKRGLSAGRVQSPALRLIVERENEIEQFKKQEYWSIHAHSSLDEKNFEAKLIEYKGEKVKQFSFCSQKVSEEVTQTLLTLANGHMTVGNVESKNRKRQPYAPFITSTLQQEASRRLGFSAQKTMVIAQQLYEGISLNDGAVGLITYMRTDSINIAQEAIFATRSFIEKTFGNNQLPPKPRLYRSKVKNAQEAHEAIRPTVISRHYNDVKPYLSEDQYKLYKLIWQRTVASQMQDAQFKVLTIDFKIGDNNTFRTTGSTLTFPGFLQVYQDISSDERSQSTTAEQSLPSFTIGQKISLEKILPQQHFTEPPPRYSEASLIKTLEEYGIGRPSTYASIITTLKKREYVTINRKRFTPTDVGRIVNRFLTQYFTQYVDYDFTAHLENELDGIASGKTNRLHVLKEFWNPFIHQIKEIGEQVSRADATQEKIDEKCPKCGAPLVIRLSKRGARFIGCTNYPECTYTSALDAEANENDATQIDRKCPKCQSALILKHGPYGKFIGCSSYPECKYLEKLEQEESTHIKCPVCHKGELLKRISRRKKKTFYACSTYPKCNYALWYEPIDKPCPKCQWPILMMKVTKKLGAQEVCPQKNCDYVKSVKDKD
jgi:DNA topoisomerase-1